MVDLSIPRTGPLVELSPEEQERIGSLNADTSRQIKAMNPVHARAIIGFVNNRRDPADLLPEPDEPLSPASL